MSMEVPWEHKVLENKQVAEDLIGAATTAAIEKVRGSVSPAFLPAPTPLAPVQVLARKDEIAQEEINTGMLDMGKEMMAGGGPLAGVMENMMRGGGPFGGGGAGGSPFGDAPGSLGSGSRNDR